MPPALLVLHPIPSQGQLVTKLSPSPCRAGQGDASPYEMHSQVKEPFSFAVQVPTVTLGAVALGKGLSLHLHAAEAMETVIIIAPRGAFVKGFDVLEE